LNNIKKIMSEAKKIFFIVGIDKLLRKYEDAYFQTKCCALFGFNAIAQECNNNNAGTLDRTIKKKKVDGKEVHLILLDNGRSELLKSKFKELLYCINCRACSELCATLSLPKESLFKAILQKKGIYDCTLCGACKDLCPLQISIPEFILEIRKKSSLSDVHKKMCESIEKYDNPFGEEKKQRSMFYTKKFEKSEGIQIYFGCVASYQRQKIVTNTMKIFDKLNIEYYCLGDDEPCCGYLLYALGVENFEKIFERTFSKIGEKVITTCAGCYKTFFELYPKYIGKNVDVLHIVQYLDSLKNFKFKNDFPYNVAYHDPCDLGRSLGIYDEPRNLLSSIPKLKLVEFKFNKENAMCCGAGGGAKAYKSELSEAIGYERMLEAYECGADTVVSSCPACYANLQINIPHLKREKNINMRVMDITEVLARAI
ncbi:MAG: (Fe-S)-binding protein, partial [Candidatus Thermoplasmatota archaeon]